MTRNELISIIQEMIAANSCCAELKKAGQDYLDAATPEARKTAAQNLIQEIQDDVATIDQAIAFYESPFALEIYGAEVRQAKLEQARVKKAAGKKWCDCPACAAGVRLLENKNLLF